MVADPLLAAVEAEFDLVAGLRLPQRGHGLRRGAGLRGHATRSTLTQTRKGTPASGWSLTPSWTQLRPKSTSSPAFACHSVDTVFAVEPSSPVDMVATPHAANIRIVTRWPLNCA